MSIVIYAALVGYIFFWCMASYQKFLLLKKQMVSCQQRMVIQCDRLIRYIEEIWPGCCEQASDIDPDLVRMCSCLSLYRSSQSLFDRAVAAGDIARELLGLLGNSSSPAVDLLQMQQIVDVVLIVASSHDHLVDSYRVLQETFPTSLLSEFFDFAAPAKLADTKPA